MWRSWFAAAGYPVQSGRETGGAGNFVAGGRMSASNDLNGGHLEPKAGAEGAMEQLFREFFWLIFPVLGMGIGALAIWTDHRRQMKGLEILRTYAEQGKEPPENVGDLLPRMIGVSSSSQIKTRGQHFAQAALLIILAAGFGYLAYRVHVAQGAWIFLWGFIITATAVGGSGVAQLVLGLTAPRTDGK
jgi:hypothetical protein